MNDPQNTSATPIKELHESLRQREEIMRRGVAAVSDAVLVAALLRSGIRKKNVVELAGEIITSLNGLSGLHGATLESLLAMKIKGLGKVKAIELAAALEIGRRAANQRPSVEPPLIETAAAAYQILKPLAEDARQEIFWVLPLNNKNRLIGAPVAIATGTFNTAALHPRDVFAPALRVSAAAILCGHNHPSGDTTPSDQDLALTSRLVDTAALLEIPLHDHLVIGRPTPQNPSGFLSLRTTGLVNFENAQRRLAQIPP